MAASTELKLRACDRCAAIKQVCDRKENRACSRCARLGRTCLINREHKPMGRPRKKRPYSETQPDTSENSPSEREESPTSDDTSCQSNDSDAKKKPIALVPAYPSPKRVHRTRSGCSACKMRRKKCDEVRPICSDCRRLRLECSLSTRSTSNSPISPRSPTICTPSSESSSPFQIILSCTIPSHLPVFGADITSDEYHLLLHYSERVSRALSVVPDEINPFQSLFIPMTLKQPAMRNALLALSASHLRRQHPHYEVVMVYYRQKAFSQMLSLLNVNTEEAMTEKLGTALCLCLHEICEGDSGDWSLHLKAATDIINSLGGPTKFPSSVQFLLEAVAYFDSIATLTFSTPALLSHSFYTPTHASPTAHALFGTAHGIFPLIAEISHLASLKSQSPLDPTFHESAVSLLSRLLPWSPPECPNTASDPSLCVKSTAAANALKSAALLRLQQIICPQLSEEQVSFSVDNILEEVERIPPGDLTESILVFPMVMAGVNARSQEQRGKVKGRLGIMEESIGFGNVVDARKFVEGAWERVDEMGEEWSWERLMGESGGTLIMS